VKEEKGENGVEEKEERMEWRRRWHSCRWWPATF
jgi:hypothetical protein